MILHLTQSFNQILAFIAKDTDGAQTNEIVFLLEKARRSLHVLKIFYDKTSPKEISSNIQIILDAISSAMAGLAGK